MPTILELKNFRRAAAKNTISQLDDHIAQALGALGAIAAAASDLPAGRRLELAEAAAEIDAALGAAIRAIHAAPAAENAENARVDTSRRPA